jgi:hypothetical protein
MQRNAFSARLGKLAPKHYKVKDYGVIEFKKKSAFKEKKEDQKKPDRHTGTS